MPAVRNFETWVPLLAVMWAIDPDGLASPGTYVAGHVDARGGWGYTWTAQLDHRLAKMVRAWLHGPASTGLAWCETRSRKQRRPGSRSS